MIKAGTVIGEIFQQHSKATSETQKVIALTLIWRNVISSNIQRHTRPVALKKGVLFVEVEDSVWLYQLTLLKNKIITDLNSHAGDSLICDIIFRNAGYSLRCSDPAKKIPPSLWIKDSLQQKTNVNVSEEKLGAAENELVETLASIAPQVWQERVRRLLNSYYRLQQWKKNQGAMMCSRCKALFGERGKGRENEKTCALCNREMKGK